MIKVSTSDPDNGHRYLRGLGKVLKEMPFKWIMKRGLEFGERKGKDALSGGTDVQSMGM